MNPMRFRISSFWLALALVASAALPPLTAWAWPGSAAISGSGQVSEQTRMVAAFSKLRLDGAITVDARPGSSASVVVRADDNLIPLVETVVEGDTLVVRTKSAVTWRTKSPIQVRVAFTQLQAVELRGSGDLTIHDFQAPDFSAALAGSGDLRLSKVSLGTLSTSVAGSGDLWMNGKTDRLSVNVAGSGDVHGGDLQAGQVQVNVAGSGDAEVYATQSVNATIAGSGDIKVRGKPAQVTKRVVGSGDIRLD